MLNMQKIDYQDDDTLLEGYCVYKCDSTSKKPAVLVCHDWSGKNDFACRKAEKLAELGYVGFAIDMFGKGKLGKTKEEKSQLIQPLMQDRARLQKRMLAAFDAVKTLPSVDTARIGVIGFCFGGLCALDLARSGAAVKGVVSFHGLLQAPPTVLESSTIQATILVLHGYNDPMVTPSTVMQFATEMTNAKANWEIDMYGHTLHAFSNPEASDPEFGTVYNAEADHRSWRAMVEFFREVL